VKKIRWLSEDERMIPSVGIGTKGTILNMPSDMADSFIKQGLAEDANEQPSLKPRKQGTKQESE